MLHPKIQLTEDIYWIGVNDRRTHLFENYWPLPNGVAYNSYLIIDEQVTLVDTVSMGTMDTFLEKIKELLAGRKIDYLIINHMEPDHSGSVKAIVNEYPEVKIIGNAKTFPMLEGFYGIHSNLLEVEEGSTLNTGRHTLHFYMTPMVHWPETMMTYDATEKILFSADAFGSFGTLDGGIFDDEINLDYYEEELRRYYSNIVGKYGLQVQKALEKLSGLDIRMIAATHGPIWRSHIPKILGDYQRWSRYETEEGVIIVFGSMYGNTEKMAEIIARAISCEGIRNIRIYDVSKTHSSYIINDIWKYKGVILGSSAYNGGVFTPMRDLIRELEHILPKNHLLGIFGSMSWGGGGVRTLEKFAETIKWDLVYEPVEARHSAREADIARLNELGKAMAARLKEDRKTN
jgi:flavorubredoxin